jgi:hypothetical protein
LRKVVDTNYLKSAELKEYLAEPGNQIVIPDLVLMERLRGGDLESICQQLELLMQHPKQVVVLKTTHAVAGLRKRRRRRLQRRLIDKEQTLGLRNFVRSSN